jgi:hypothetical protein
MKKYTLLVAALATSASSFASMEFKCTGKTAKETLKFAVDDSEGLQIDAVSKALCAGYTSISPEEGDEGAWLSVDENRRAGAKTVKYDTWDGNWGFTLTIPSKIADGGSLKKFKVGYRFDYNDIETAKVIRTLDCVKVE